MAKKLISTLLVILLSFIGCRVKETWQTSTLFYFDTVCELRLLCSPPLFRECQKDVSAIFSEIEKSFSPGAKDISSPLVLGLFHKAQLVHSDSGGYFDITVAPLSRLWGFRNQSYRIPSPEEIKACLNDVGLSKIREENNRLILGPRVELDWGGIAKGLGIDLACQALKKKNVSRGFVNAGGDLFCWGTNAENSRWKVGIKHPRKKGFLGILNISDLAAATSGDYQRFFEIKGIRYHHIFDPKTGHPAQDKQAVTVIGPEAAFCDALSTAIFASPHPESILKKHPEYGAIIVDGQGRIYQLGRKYSFEAF